MTEIFSKWSAKCSTMLSMPEGTGLWQKRHIIAAQLSNESCERSRCRVQLHFDRKMRLSQPASKHMYG